MADTDNRLARLLSGAYGEGSFSTANVLDNMPAPSPLDDARGYLARYMRRPDNPNPPTQEQWNALSYEPERSEPNAVQKGLANVLANPDLQPAFLAANFIAPNVRLPVPRVANPIKAYHGSPHDFDKFDLGKIGTGEGAQAYGHGLYFAENEGVARYYKRHEMGKGAKTINGEVFDYTNPAHLAADYIDAWGPDAIAQIKRDIATRNDHTRARYEKAAQLIETDPASVPSVNGPARMYEVALHATPEQFLDWDKPLSGQSSAVRKSLAATSRAPMLREDLGGPFKGLHVAPDTPAQIDEFRGAGIPGIKYLDQGSRGAGQGTSNYVVWTPEIIELLRKYGIAAPVAGGALANALSSEDPSQ